MFNKIRVPNEANLIFFFLKNFFLDFVLVLAIIYVLNICFLMGRTEGRVYYS